MANVPFVRLVLVTDSALCGVGETLSRLRDMSLDARVAVEVREKAMATRALVSFATAVREVTAHVGAALVVNDRVDVALAVGADGVHLPANELAPDVVRRLAGAMFIGRSIHTAGESANAGADYFRFGPVFPTPSKAAFGAPQGLSRLRDAVSQAGGRPIYAVGGIDLAQIHAVRGAGAHGIAVIRDWLSARDPARWLSDALARLSDPA